MSHLSCLTLNLCHPHFVSLSHWLGEVPVKPQCEGGGEIRRAVWVNRCHRSATLHQRRLESYVSLPFLLLPLTHLLLHFHFQLYILRLLPPTLLPSSLTSLPLFDFHKQDTFRCIFKFDSWVQLVPVKLTGNT